MATHKIPLNIKKCAVGSHNGGKLVSAFGRRDSEHLEVQPSCSHVNELYMMEHETQMKATGHA